MTSSAPSRPPCIGVIVVAYDAEAVLPTCLESVFASDSDAFRAVVVDNASPDRSVEVLRDWASGALVPEFPEGAHDPARRPAPKPVAVTELDEAEARAAAPADWGRLALVRAEANRGFAAGVNLGLDLLSHDPEIGVFWILNPDGIAHPGTLGALAEAATRRPDFGLMGGRVRYCEPPGLIQSDCGGRIDRWTGICRSLHIGMTPESAPQTRPETLDYVCGAHMAVSRAFVEEAGPMPEEYFLYYEEIDWALRRGRRPIVYAPEALVHHHGGASIGSGTPGRSASAFANYFNYRNRMRFMRRFRPHGLPTAYLYSLAKIGRLLLGGEWGSAIGAARGLHGLPPGRRIRARLGPEAAALAFAPTRGGG